MYQNFLLRFQDSLRNNNSQIYKRDNSKISTLSDKSSCNKNNDISRQENQSPLEITDRFNSQLSCTKNLQNQSIKSKLNNKSSQNLIKKKSVDTLTKRLSSQESDNNAQIKQKSQNLKMSILKQVLKKKNQQYYNIFDEKNPGIQIPLSLSRCNDQSLLNNCEIEDSKLIETSKVKQLISQTLLKKNDCNTKRFNLKDITNDKILNQSNLQKNTNEFTDVIQYLRNNNQKILQELQLKYEKNQLILSQFFDDMIHMIQDERSNQLHILKKNLENNQMIIFEVNLQIKQQYENLKQQHVESQNIYIQKRFDKELQNQIKNFNKTTIINVMSDMKKLDQHVFKMKKSLQNLFNKKEYEKISLKMNIDQFMNQKVLNSDSNQNLSSNNHIGEIQKIETSKLFKVDTNFSFKSYQQSSAGQKTEVNSPCFELNNIKYYDQQDSNIILKNQFATTPVQQSKNLTPYIQKQLPLKDDIFKEIQVKNSSYNNKFFNITPDIQMQYSLSENINQDKINKSSDQIQKEFHSQKNYTNILDYNKFNDLINKLRNKENELI